MELILAQIVRFLKSEASILEREKKLNGFLEKLNSYLVEQALLQVDESLKAQMKARGYRIDKAPARQVTFLFGTVHFKRRCYIKEGEKPIYPVDELLGIEAKQSTSRYVSSVFAQASTLGVFRQVSEVIDLVSPLSISHQKLHQLSLEVGSRIDQAQDNDFRLRSGHARRRQVPVLYVEGDGFCLRKQGGGKLEVHRVQVHEGKDKQGHLVNYRTFIDLDRERAFEQLENYLGLEYEMSTTQLVTNSDEGSGYQKADFTGLCEQGTRHEHFIDRYHVSKKLRERLKCVPALVEAFQRALTAYDKDSLIPLYDTFESCCETASDLEDLRLLRGYLERNWAYLRPWHKRPSLKGIGKELGSCESHHRVFTYRMKKQGKCWSERGAQSMIKLLAAKQNGDFERYSAYELLPESEGEGEDWSALYKFYHKPLGECKKTSKWDYSRVGQAHLTSSVLRSGFRI